MDIDWDKTGNRQIIILIAWFNQMMNEIIQKKNIEVLHVEFLPALVDLEHRGHQAFPDPGQYLLLGYLICEELAGESKYISSPLLLPVENGAGGSGVSGAGDSLGLTANSQHSDHFIPPRLSFLIVNNWREFSPHLCACSSWDGVTRPQPPPPPPRSCRRSCSAWTTRQSRHWHRGHSSHRWEVWARGSRSSWRWSVCRPQGETCSLFSLVNFLKVLSSVSASDPLGRKGIMNSLFPPSIFDWSSQLFQLPQRQEPLWSSSHSWYWRQSWRMTCWSRTNQTQAWYSRSGWSF